ncbi:MAG: metallophosphoesterase, partial [Methylobacteriaceae bacterium]|nr:metallophosphoesterase [Methylobacteriaceae bacterium]
EAFDAALAALAREGVDRIALLGDLVGYGADPSYVVDKAAELVDKGAIALKGNHDEAAVSGDGAGMNDYARAAIEWTAQRLDAAQKNFLANLAMTHREGDRLLVHSEAVAPSEWRYVTDAREAERSMRATDARVTICGHVHRPQVYNMPPQRPAIAFTPNAGTPIPLLAQRVWLAVLGAVGQPRDENPAASYAVLDEAAKSICYRRAPYDIETAARKIRDAALPQILAARLFVGR